MYSILKENNEADSGFKHLKMKYMLNNKSFSVNYNAFNCNFGKNKKEK